MSPRHCLPNVRQSGVDAGDLAQHLGVRAQHQPKHQFVLQVQRHHRDFLWALAHLKQSLPSADHLGIGHAEREARLHLQLRGLGKVKHHVHDPGWIEIEVDRQKRLFRRCLNSGFGFGTIGSSAILLGILAALVVYDMRRHRLQSIEI